MYQGKMYRQADYSAPEKGTWRITWWNTNPATNELERVRKTFNLNRVKNIQDRHKAAMALCKEINKALSEGWNYFVHENGDGSQTNNEPLPIQKDMLLSDAIHDATRIKCLSRSHSSVKSYQSLSTVFLGWLKENGHATTLVHTFRAKDYQLFIESRIAAGHSSRNINAHITHAKALFDKMIHPLEHLENNPLKAFKLLKEEESTRFEPLTKEELERVATHLKKEHPRFFLYTQFIYYAYIRPAHIPTLQRKQIDFEAGTISIVGGNTKTGRNATKQLLSPLANSLKELGIDKLDPDDYIFSDRRFQPGKKKLVSLDTRAQELWLAEVIKGLGIDKKMYALKHTSGSLYISENENVDIAWLQKQMEHATLAETEAYVRKRKAKMIDESKVNWAAFGNNV